MLKRFNENWGPIGGLNFSKYNKIPGHIEKTFSDCAITYNNFDEMRDICSRLVKIGYDVYNSGGILNKINVIDYDCFFKKYDSNTFKRGYLNEIKDRPINIIAYEELIEITDEIINKKQEFGKPGDKIVVGIPSGQIIYMNEKQITYFEARKLIVFKNQYKKKKKENYYEIVKLNAYCFDDKFYENITDLMDSILW